MSEIIIEEINSKKPQSETVNLQGSLSSFFLGID